MKRLLLCVAAAALVAAFAGTGTGTAQAKCGVKCLNKKVNRLSGQLAQAQATISQQAQLINQTRQDLDCLGEAPLTAYGDPAGSFGYQFDNDAIGSGDNPFLTSALDVTVPGDLVHAWFLVDVCNTATVASTSAARSSVAPHSALGLFGGPGFRSP